MGTVGVILILVILIGLSVRKMYRDKKSGNSCCSGNCGSCGGCR